MPDLFDMFRSGGRLTVPGGLSRLSHMRIERGNQVLIVRGLLFVWLFMGFVALSELSNLWPETSTQDEEALAQLAFGLKSDMVECLEPSGIAVTPQFGGSSARFSVLASPAAHPLIVHMLLSPPLPQRMSVLRI